jgi:molybdopterin-containing oxidoreductase family membrane subunit
MVSFIGRAVLGLLIFDVILEWAEFSVPMWYGVGHEYDHLMRVLFGEFWWVFWILHVALGTLLPGALLVFRGSRAWAVATAGLLIAVTFMTVRLNIVIPGLLDPHLRGLQNAFTDHRLVFWYVPSWFEWRVTFFIVAVGAALFYLGNRFLPLTEHHARRQSTR